MELLFVFIKNAKNIAFNVLKANVFVNIKKEKADVLNVMVVKYVVMVIVNIVA